MYFILTLTVGDETFNAVIVADVPHGLPGEWDRFPEKIALVTVVPIKKGDFVRNIYGWNGVRTGYSVSYAIPQVSKAVIKEFEEEYDDCVKTVRNPSLSSIAVFAGNPERGRGRPKKRVSIKDSAGKYFVKV